MTGPNGLIYKKAAKRMQIKVPVPQGFLGDVTVRINNTGYDNDVFVDLCGMAVIDVGTNLPCVDLKSDTVATNMTGEEFKFLPDGYVVQDLQEISLQT